MNDYSGHNWTLHVGDVREVLAELPERSVHCCVTSPPYWGLRDYGVDGQLGNERTPEEYVANMVEVFAAVKRVLRDDGTLWLNLGDSYSNDTKWGGKSGGKNAHSAAGGYQGQRVRRGTDCDPKRGKAAEGQPMKHCTGLKPKDLVGIPWRVALALQQDGWYLRRDIIWNKPNPMPESVQDRPATAHEYIFLLSKSERYFFDMEAVKERVTGNAHARGNGVNPKSASIDPGNHRDRPKQNASFSAAVAKLVSSRNCRSVWSIASQSYSEAHFATFPEKLPARCILAGTSEKGCCPECGAPWRRIVERVRRPTRPGETSKVFKTPDGWDTEDGAHGTIHRKGREKGDTGYVHKEHRESIETGNRDPERHVTETKTTGWQPTCDCEPRPALGPRDALNCVVNGEWDMQPVPCVVLDPFAGSGTTLKVARDLGRIGIGSELSPDYAEMAERRIIDPKRYAANGHKSIEPAEGQQVLF